jgi:hypothetical protein
MYTNHLPRRYLMIASTTALLVYLFVILPLGMVLAAHIGGAIQSSVSSEG